jgi:prepilin-type N-terminal cleavage/methylation domain-containing protein/prepilin-type processing-associated H-X9-DG protein
MNIRARARAFSMTELLVVIAVILILAATLIVGLNGVYARAVQIKCQHRLEQIGQALQMYVSGEHGRWPAVWNPSTGKSWFHVLAAERVSDPMVLACPSVGVPPLVITEGVAAQEEKREQADAVWKALRWLKSKQSTEGRIPTKGFYWPQSSTGLALLAFFGAGCTDKHPSEFADTVRLTVEYLSSSAGQYKTGTNMGRFTQSGETAYNQGICTMALAAASQMVEDPDLRSKARAAAQLAVNWLVDASDASEYGCFNYDAPITASMTSNTDTSASSWCYLGMAGARDSGLTVPQRVFDKASETSQGFFYWGYAAWEGGSAYYRFGVPNPRKHFSGGQRNTGILLAARLICYDNPSGTPAITKADYMHNSNQPASTIIAMESNGESHTYAIYWANEAFERMGGKYLEKWRAQFFPQRMMPFQLPEGDDMAYWPNTACHDIGGSWSSRGEWGDAYATAMACLALEASFTDHWLKVDGVAPIAEASYGYSNRLGLNGQTVSADTIVVMDYQDWEIDRDLVDPDDNDTDADIALRHRGQANALFGDSSVRPLSLEEIKPGMWTPEPGD